MPRTTMDTCDAGLGARLNDERGKVRRRRRRIALSSFQRSARRPSPETPRGTAQSRLRHLRDVDVEVGGDLLHVVEVLELVEQLEERLGGLALDAHRGLRDVRDLRLRDRDAPRL